jgi:hypothetical protein
VNAEFLISLKLFVKLYYEYFLKLRKDIQGLTAAKAHF